MEKVESALTIKERGVMTEARFSEPQYWGWPTSRTRTTYYRNQQVVRLIMLWVA